MTQGLSRKRHVLEYIGHGNDVKAFLVFEVREFHAVSRVVQRAHRRHDGRAHINPHDLMSELSGRREQGAVAEPHVQLAAAQPATDRPHGADDSGGHVAGGFKFLPWRRRLVRVGDFKHLSQHFFREIPFREDMFAARALDPSNCPRQTFAVVRICGAVGFAEKLDLLFTAQWT